MPDLGLGMRPLGTQDATKPARRGPSYRAWRRRRRSRSRRPRSAPPNPRRRRCPRRPLRPPLAFSPLAKTATRTLLPGAVGEDDRAPHLLIGVARIDAQLERDVDALVKLGSRHLLHERHRRPRTSYSLSRSTFLAASWYFFPHFATMTSSSCGSSEVGTLSHRCQAFGPARSVLDGDAHAASRPFDHAHRRFDVRWR